MSKSIEQRPPQVTFAGTIVIAASVMALVTAWDRVANLRSLDSRNAVEEFLSESPGAGLGLDIDDVLAVLHVSGVVAAVCATITGILGWYVLKGDKASRLVLAVVAVPLFISGMTIGGFASSFVGAAAVMLWLAPASEWFATGRWTPPPPREEVKREQQALERPPSLPPLPAAPTEPRPAERPYATEPNHAEPAHAELTREGDPRGASPMRRPAAVVAAFVITTTMTFMVAMAALVAVLVVATAPDLVMEQLALQPGTEDVTLEQVRTSTYVSAASILFMCVVGLAFASLGLRRLEWARRGWMVAAGLSATGCVLVIATAPGAGLVAVLPGVAAVAALAMLQRQEVRRWFASGPRRGA